MNEEHKEILIWGGSALVLVVVLAWLTSSQAQEVDAHNRVIDQNYPEYQRLYAKEGEGESSAFA